MRYLADLLKAARDVVGEKRKRLARCHPRRARGRGACEGRGYRWLDGNWSILSSPNGFYSVATNFWALKRYRGRMFNWSRRAIAVALFSASLFASFEARATHVKIVSGLIGGQDDESKRLLALPPAEADQAA